MDEELDNIFADKISGSEDLLEKINNFVRSNSHSKHKLKTLILYGKDRLCPFQTIQNYFIRLDEVISSDDPKMIEIFADEFHSSKARSYDLIYDKLKEKIRDFDSVFTLSNSRTVYEIITRWKKDKENIKVFIIESRPACEGKVLAENLMKKNIEVVLSPDGNMTSQIKNAGFVLLGADRIKKNSYIINKRGSFAAALLAKSFNKPVFAAAASDKFVDFFADDQAKDNQDEGRDYNTTVTNNNFETVDVELITAIITD